MWSKLGHLEILPHCSHDLKLRIQDNFSSIVILPCLAFRRLEKGGDASRAQRGDIHYCPWIITSSCPSQTQPLPASSCYSTITKFRTWRGSWRKLLFLFLSLISGHTEEKWKSRQENLSRIFWLRRDYPQKFDSLAQNVLNGKSGASKNLLKQVKTDHGPQRFPYKKLAETGSHPRSNVWV